MACYNKKYYEKGMVINGFTMVSDPETVRYGKRYAHFQCIHCPKTFFALITRVVQGIRKSCGCKKYTAMVDAQRTHGLTKTTEYQIWAGMKTRCYNSAEPAYKNYGGRGINVCDAWLDDFPQFLKDVGKRPSPTLTIDRINVNGNYEPGNVRWATKREQRRNQRDNVVLTYKGQTKILIEWCEELGLKYKLMAARIKAGKTVEQAFETPVAIKDQSYLQFRKSKSII